MRKILTHHKHCGGLSIDQIAQRSKLNRISPMLKAWVCLICLFLSIISPARTGLLLTVIMLCITVFIGKLSLRAYLGLLMILTTFIILSSLAILFDFSTVASGVLNIPFSSGWIIVSARALTETMLIFCRAMGAISSLYMLSLSTPMSEIIEVLRRMHIPALIIELMYLIYRYIFLLLETYRNMHEAAQSRLGFQGLRRSLHTTGQIYANMLAYSYRRANRCLEAMESRCYTGELRFWAEKKSATPSQIGVAVVLLIVVLFSAMGG